MPDFYRNIADMQGSIEQLMRRVPGFRGYLELEDRRMADRLLREKLVLVLEGHLGEFGRLQRRLIDESGIGLMERVRAIDGSLRTLVDTIESAAGGYAGLFDAVKIDRAALDRVYVFDSAMFAYQDQLAAGMRRLGEVIGSEGVNGVLDELELVVDGAVRNFDHRVEAMRGLQGDVDGR